MLPDAYGCVVANRFGELLDDDDADPFDLIREAESEKDKKKKKKKQEEEKKAKQKKPGQKESQKDRRVRIEAAAAACKQPQQQTRPGPVSDSRRDPEEAQRGLKRVAAAAAGERRANRQDDPQEFSVPQPSYSTDSDFRGRGGIRGRRVARGGGYTRNPDSFNMRGKREYDRHNGTGISPEEKRGGRGPWNWGCVEEPTSELMDVTNNIPVKAEDGQIMADEENQTQAVEEEDGEMVVQVAMEMSLDEWKAIQEESRSKAEFNIRKAEDKIPSKAKVIHQSKQPENLKVTLEDLGDEGNFLRRSVNDITSLMDINFGSLGRPSRGGRGRGARGGGTNRPEKAKPILEKEDDLAPNPDDPEDFPALSTGR